MKHGVEKPAVGGGWESSVKQMYYIWERNGVIIGSDYSNIRSL